MLAWWESDLVLARLVLGFFSLNFAAAATRNSNGWVGGIRLTKGQIDGVCQYLNVQSFERCSNISVLGDYHSACCSVRTPTNSIPTRTYAYLCYRFANISLLASRCKPQLENPTLRVYEIVVLYLS